MIVCDLCGPVLGSNLAVLVCKAKEKGMEQIISSWESERQRCFQTSAKKANKVLMFSEVECELICVEVSLGCTHT